ncbi:hypothetical protein Mal52_37530 [Symmachiella dynata]|uniref:DUF1501 domain-containing protein n=1 Tax=Symmachiella dynata TaxID=2527995 RepID=A0A517ZS00_9PLAN|nr:DUF1501 domain-containing protein [Symmachiella dynata]QDU45261.1 hypothetical protein Mal52_37530 [Symmachiella dynata]
MGRSRFCDGVRRRDMLTIGAAGMFGAGLSMSQMLQLQAAAAEQGKSTDDISLIILFLQGGISTIDTWDMKPNAPAEFRGEFDPIATSVPGIQLCEHLPHLAQQMDKFSLVRSFAHRNSSHGHADHFILTGYHPTPAFDSKLKPNNEKPSHGSVIAKKLGPRGSVPAYVALPKMHNSGGGAFLGSDADPFTVAADPNTPNFAVRDLAPPLTVPAARLGHRRDLLAMVDRYQSSAEVAANQSARALSTFQQRAFDLMTSPETKRAFDIGDESKKLRDEYGRHTLGQSCLMARRLVEAGVRCVLVHHSDWDTHNDNFHMLKNRLLPKLDTGMSTLFRDLSDRGMLENTFVLVTGEFGRTPRINKDAGRDHWGPSTALAMGGGGMTNGIVVGDSGPRAERPVTNPYGPKDLAATIYHSLGISPETIFHTPEGRPMPIVPHGGKVIGELFS